MSVINSLSTNSDLSSSRFSNITETQNKEAKKTAQKNIIIKPNANPEAKTYLVKKSRIEASPMEENIRIAIDVKA